MIELASEQRKNVGFPEGFEVRPWHETLDSQRRPKSWRGISLAFIALMLSPCTLGQDLSQGSAPAVSETVELLSIVFRLAGSQEYNTTDLPQYAQDIDRYFLPVKQHPAVLTAKRYADEKGVGFDAVMSMAVSLSPPPLLVPRRHSREWMPDVRWGEDADRDFLPELRDFYSKSHFADFFRAHEPLYLEAQRRLQRVVSQVDLGWFIHFYGSDTGIAFRFVIGMNNGSGFYGPRFTLPDGRQEIYAIVGAGPHDPAGIPVFSSDSVLPLIIHELSHSFVNPAVDANWSEFARVNQVFESVRSTMERQAYSTSQAMVYESLVRAAVIIYFRDHAEPQSQMARRIREEELKGFFWMPELVATLERCEEFASNRTRWNGCIKMTAALYARLEPAAATKAAAFESSIVHVKELRPFLNHSDGIDPSVEKIEIIFDQPVAHIEGPFVARTRSHENPVSGPPVVSSDQVELALRLQPHTTYGFKILGASVGSKAGLPAEDYIVEFRTK